MNKWYIKDLSQLTQVSVQTLHHYDRIGLLKPSLRSSKGYRVYSQKDLLRLQQIIALKFFGFELSTIKGLLDDRLNAIQHLKAQAFFLAEKARQMLEASQTLKTMIVDVGDQHSLPWESIIQIIETYKMTQKLEHAWLKDIFTNEELKEYAIFEEEWKKKPPAEDKRSFEKKWLHLVETISQNFTKSPESEIGISLGRECLKILNEAYGKKYAYLRTKQFEEGFKKGKGLKEVGLTPEVLLWMDKAMHAYFKDRIYGILNQIGSGVSNEKILKLWEDVFGEMYGEDTSRKKEVCDLIIADQKVPQ